MSVVAPADLSDTNECARLGGQADAVEVPAFDFSRVYATSVDWPVDPVDHHQRSGVCGDQLRGVIGHGHRGAIQVARHHVRHH